MKRRVKKIVTILNSKKGENIVVFNLEKSDYFVDNVVVVTSMAERHGQSLMMELKNRLKPEGEEFLHIDESDDWIAIDMGDIIVHIMSQEKRDVFRLEELLNSINRVKSESVKA